jgi:hypothetical protein
MVPSLSLPSVKRWGTDVLIDVLILVGCFQALVLIVALKT